jgi:hypothetical protein
LQLSLTTLLTRFLSQKAFHSLSFSINYAVETLPDSVASSYSDMTAQPHIYPDSNLVNLFSDLHAKAVVNPGAHRYSLFFVNSTRRPVPLTYGTSDLPSPCFALNVRAAFCHLELDSSPPLPVLFNRTSQFVERFLVPWGEARKIESRIVISVVTFGPVVRTSSLQNTLDSLFPSLDIVVVVTRNSILDFPVVAAAASSQRSIADAINHLPAPPAGFAFYVFEAPLFSYIRGPALFVSDWNAEAMVVSAVLARLDGSNNAMVDFGGHHPLFPAGGADSFSPLLSDAFGRGWALRNVAYACQRHADAIRKLDAIELEFVNRTVGSDAEIRKLLARTMQRISAGEIVKAVSASERAVQLADGLAEAAKKRAGEARLFGQCCPKMIVVSQPRNEMFVGIVIAVFFFVVVWLAVKCWRLAGKRRFGIPAALMF